MNLFCLASLGFIISKVCQAESNISGECVNYFTGKRSRQHISLSCHTQEGTVRYLRSTEPTNIQNTDFVYETAIPESIS